MTSKAQFNVRLPEHLAERARAKAKTGHQSVQDYVETLIERDLDPAREPFVAGMVDDMVDLLPEFKDLDPGRR